MKVDVGYHRAGVPCSDQDQILTIAKVLLEHSNVIKFQGLYAHCGNSYKGNMKIRIKLVYLLLDSKGWTETLIYLIQNAGDKTLWNAGFWNLPILTLETGFYLKSTAEKLNVD